MMRPYYDAGGVTLYHGRAEDVLPTLAFDGIDLLCTDPPYPGYEKGWDVPEVAAILAAIPVARKLIFWPPLLPPPLGPPGAEHIWHKPNGQSAHHYERILGYGDVPRGCKVYRVAAILPNYAQYAREAVGHPTQKPVRLVRQLLVAHKPRAVLDCFAGSGTTLRAAKDLGLRAIGIEQDAAYCAIAAARLAQDVLPLYEEATA